MKKLILSLAILFLSSIVNGQTKVQKTCYGFLTENYGTILVEDVALFKTCIIEAVMPYYYTEDLLKEDVQTLILTNKQLSLEQDWSYNTEENTITCILLVNSIERLTILYSDEFNLLYFYYKWNGMKE